MTVEMIWNACQMARPDRSTADPDRLSAEEIGGLRWDDPTLRPTATVSGSAPRTTPA
jgi:hypothetical protein